MQPKPEAAASIFSRHSPTLDRLNAYIVLFFVFFTEAYDMKVRFAKLIAGLPAHLAVCPFIGLSAREFASPKVANADDKRMTRARVTP